jgi:class 3 adenylate cyclase
MKLRSKLLLGIGVLLLGMVIIVYVVPTFFIRKDVYSAADSIHSLLIKDQQELRRAQQIWIEDALEHIKETIDSLLSMVVENPTIPTQLDFKSQESEIWNILSHITGYEPSIGFVQAHAPSSNKTALLSPGAAHLYPVKQLLTHGGIVFLTISELQKNGQESERVFIGFPLLSKEKQSENPYSLYALLDPKKFIQELTVVYEEITELTPEYVQKHLSALEQISPTSIMENTSKAFTWATKIDMIRELTPFYVKGLAFNQLKSVVPEGLARIDQTGHGYVILSEEVYATTPLFDDVLYYNTHLPKKGDIPLANGAALIPVPKERTAYIGNTLMLGSTYLTIGSPLEMLTHQLALSSNKIILLQANRVLWLGYDGKGNRLSSQEIDRMLAASRDRGNNQGYNFTKITSVENGNLTFYALQSSDSAESIVGTLLNLEDKLTRRISTLLLLIALGTMLFVLLFIGRLSLSVIYPITKLAKATSSVVAGRYEEVVLPDVSGRNDEVAVLIRSFDNMVHGLQDREKIRGVLDKVVSKDVADEILRTRIHLGGEDRVISMLFADIRGFTELSAHLPPQKTIQLLNECMTKVSRVIEGEGGVIDKYVGDAVMAIYGAPTTHPEHALRAISSALLIIETLKKWNQERAAAGESLVEMGIGIHSGLVVAGNMGAEDRLNYTVLGAHVNLASRLCEIAKPNQLIVSAATLAERNIEASFYAHPLPPIILKGFKEPVQIYEITGFKWATT